MGFQNIYNFFGVCSGWGERVHETEFAAESVFKYIKNAGLAEETYNIINIKPAHTLENTTSGVGKESLPLVYEAADISRETILAYGMSGFPVIIGGDHSIAIGTWAAEVAIYQAQEQFGLIWVDAHMDAHTYESSPSKAYHGMPLACLLGYGDEELVNMGGFKPKLSPKHLVLIGVRSFEIGERQLLERLGVRIIYMNEIRQNGFNKCFGEALEIASHTTKGFGLSIDMDAFDPVYAPGVGSPVPDGLRPREVLDELKQLKSNERFKALEIAEYNPRLDNNSKTMHLIYQILREVIC